MIGKDEQAYVNEEKHRYAGYADVFISSNDITLRSSFLAQKFEQGGLCFISKGNGTHSIILTPIEEESSSLDLVNENGYINMSGNNHTYVNLIGVSKEFKKVQRKTQGKADKVSINQEHKHSLVRAEPCQNVSSLGGDQDGYNHESTYHINECVDGIAMNNKSKTKISLKNAVVSLLPCCACCIKTR